MTTETVIIEETTYNFCLLRLKAGETAITYDGRTITTAYLGVVNVNPMIEPTNYSEDWQLGIWESLEKYKGFLQRQQYCQPVNNFGLPFNAGAVPIQVLNLLSFNESWLFNRAISEPFLNTILALPDPSTGQPFGSRWEIY